MSGYISTEGLYWEMKAIIKNNYCRAGLNLNQKFNEMKEELVKELKEVIEENREDLIKEIKKEEENGKS